MLPLFCIVCTSVWLTAGARSVGPLPMKNPKSNRSLELENSVHPPLLIGSFNIQTLGPKKFNNPDVIYTVEKIIHRYDLILLLEVMTTNPSFMNNLLTNVNLFAPDGVTYNMTLSTRQNDTGEHAAVFYRTDKLKLLKAESYNNPDKFYRQPLVAIFEALTLRDMAKFGMVGHHVKPAKAVQEIDALAGVYDYAVQEYGTKDVILMGDFNADCTYVKEMDWENISLWTRPEFTWAITGHTDTTTNYKSCALDRFVYAGENMNNGVILESAQIFNFQKAFELTLDEVRRISDHWPIEIKIRGRMSDTAEKHLSTRICFEVQDSRPRIVPQDSLQQLNHFNITKIAGGILLTNTTTEETDLLRVLTTLRSSLPNAISPELEQALRYKIAHGTLKDESSFAEVWKPSFTVTVLVRKGNSQATVCRTTSVN